MTARATVSPPTPGVEDPDGRVEVRGTLASLVARYAGRAARSRPLVADERRAHEPARPQRPEQVPLPGDLRRPGSTPSSMPPQIANSTTASRICRGCARRTRGRAGTPASRRSARTARSWTCSTGPMSHTPTPDEQPDHGRDHDEPLRDPARHREEPEDEERHGVGQQVRPSAVQQRRPDDAVRARTASGARCLRCRGDSPVSWSTNSITYSSAVKASMTSAASTGCGGRTRATDRRGAGAGATMPPRLRGERRDGA